MQRRPYNKKGKPATLMCSNPRCNNISSKLYIVEDKLIEALKIWLNNYKIDYNAVDIQKNDNSLLIKQSINSTRKELENENNKLDKLYDFLESGVYSKNEFITRSNHIKETIKNLENKLEEYTLLFEKSAEAQKEKQNLIPKLENIIELYNKLETAEDKNILLKSIIAKVTYLKTEKAIKKISDPTNFELHIYPKIPKI